MEKQKQPFWEVLNLPAPGTLLTAAAYDALPEVNFHVEYIDGKVIYPNWDEATMSPTPIPIHQDVVINIGAYLKRVAREQNGKAYIAPLAVMLDDGRRVEPDVMYLTPESRCVVEEKRLRGLPELVVEVLSPSTAKYDRDEKYKLYEENGVREYWIVDPRDHIAEVYVFEDTAFIRFGVFGEGDTFQSPTLEQKSVEVSEFFED